MKHKWLMGTLFIWAIVLCVPSLRYALRVSLTNSPWLRYSALPPGKNYGSEIAPIFPGKNAPLAVQAMNVINKNQGFIADVNMKILPPLDQLLQQNPDVPWLIAVRLQQTVQAFSKNRQGGEFSDARSFEEIRKGPPSKDKTDNQINWTPQQMRETLALCARGEKLEPQNGFFPWMRMYFLMIDWQDEKAMQALRAAASATYWNNHAIEFTQLYANAAQRILKRPLTSYEKMTIAASPMNFSLNARMREMGRILGWKGVKLNRAGNHEAALRLWFDYYHAMTLAAQGASFPLDFLASYAMTSIASVGASYPDLSQPKREHLKEKERIQRFVTFARKYQRSDLAQQIDRDWHANYEAYQDLKKYIAQKGAERAITQIYQWSTLLAFSALIIISMAGAVAGELVVGGLKFLHSRKSTFGENVRQDASAAKSTFSASFWQRCKGVLACSGLPSLVLGGCFLAVLIFLLSALMSQDSLYGVVGGWRACDFTRISADSPMWETISSGFNRMNGGTFGGKWRVFVFLTPLLCGGLYALVESCKKERQSFKRAIFLAALLLAWGVLALTSEYHFAQIFVGSICALFLLFSLFLLWRKSRSKSTFAEKLFQSSLQGWICAASIAALILFIGQTALDNQLRPHADDQLRGEMRLLHEVRDASR